ncbi:exportin-6-like, partial [Temnothorax curvispinosus]|uniref:Exportin-6-like n=1 Tax=Temnothorax curvispinosus TaxID=300111 RepID=A0A6J1QCB6_9HYME
PVAPLLKLVVDIARHDWPHFYPDFYSNILQLLGHKHTRLLGLVYLRTALEELATPREDLPMHRKSELFRLLSAQVPLTLDTLTVLLKETTNVQSRSGTVTPPPSPTSGQSLAPARAVLDVEGLATGTSEVCTATLEVLAHLFSWIDVSGSISSNLIDAIFTCAKYHDAMNGKQIEMAVQALTTIHELLYRPFSPDETDTLLLEIFQNGVGLFQLMERLDSVEESYMEKMTEFLQLFITNHMKKMESSSKFPVNTLLERILQKMSFKLNARVLRDLDTENLDENEETEWQHFLRCNIECLAKIADISPIPIFTLLYRSWREGLIVFGELGAAVANGRVILLNDAEASNVHAHLRDLASITQALTRLYFLFIGDQANIDQGLAEEVVSQTLEACMFARDNQLYKAAIQPAAIVIDLIEVHSQLLASLQAWCHWIARRPKAKETLCQRCIDSCLWATTYTASCDHPPPPNLIHSAIHLFQSITAILKPILWDQPTFRNLISMGTYPYLKSDTIKVLRRALINGIILPPLDLRGTPGESPQAGDGRSR